MGKKIRALIPALTLFAAGAAFYGVVQTCIVIGLGRVSGMGGEVLILPLLVLMVSIGWMGGKRRGAVLRKQVVQDNWMDGYRRGVRKAEERRVVDDAQNNEAVL